MRLLPREHGATVIWFASLVLALGSLPPPGFSPRQSVPRPFGGLRRRLGPRARPPRAAHGRLRGGDADGARPGPPPRPVRAPDARRAGRRARDARAVVAADPGRVALVRDLHDGGR